MSQSLAENSAMVASTPNGRTVLVVGGSLLIASTGIALVARYATLPDLTFPLLGGQQYLPTLVYGALFAAGVLVFAWGWRGQGSVVARRPVGVIALSLFGAWNLLVSLFAPPLLAANPGPTAIALLIYFGLPLLQVVVGMIGVTSIVRARAVPGAWRWLPMLALVPYIVLAFATYASFAYYQAVDVIAIAWLVILGANVVLGVAAIGWAIAARRRLDALSTGAVALDEQSAEPHPTSDAPNSTP